MALIKCPECSSEVSDSALKCPSCGKQLRKAKRTFFGKLCKWAFILYNILMAVWLFAGVNATSKMVAVSEAERAGQAIGTGIGVSLILGIWLFGAIVLGLFALLTRAKS